MIAYVNVAMIPRHRDRVKGLVIQEGISLRTRLFVDSKQSIENIHEISKGQTAPGHASGFCREFTREDLDSGLLSPYYRI